MNKDVTTIFLSMALTVAFTRLVSVGATPVTWAVFIYFGFRKVSYYITDIKFSELCENVFVEDSIPVRMFDLFLGVLTLFMFIVTGYYVVEPTLFYFISALALSINLVWLILLNNAIDPNKDNNNKITISRMFKNFMIINGVEIVLFLFASIWLDGKYSFNNHKFEDFEVIIHIMLLTLLALIMILDMFLHREFLFNPNYTCQNTEES